jgi:hypothetical protein
MSDAGSRRFTDREVAIVLRKASELEEHDDEIGGGGLSLTELEEIAGEVGISRTAVAKAVEKLDGQAHRGSLLAGGPLAHRAIRAVEGELHEEGLARLVRHVDGGSDAVGVVSEALGATRWTAADRFRTTQVSITPAAGETTIQVVERATARLRRIVHLVPASASLALVGGTIGGFDLSSLTVTGLMALGFGAGATLGRMIWSRLSLQRAARVERLAEELSLEAAQLAPGSNPDDPASVESD